LRSATERETKLLVNNSKSVINRTISWSVPHPKLSNAGVTCTAVMILKIDLLFSAK